MDVNSENNMHYGASPEIFENAKILRSNQTAAERKLWECIRDSKLGFKFRRQHPLSDYIADFYCHKIKLVIEIDGDYHLESEQQIQDEFRTRQIEELGIAVIRFTNEQVLLDIDNVLVTIKNHISELV